MKRTVLAPAKLNLFLDITGRRRDGYHLVNMVMQSVSLYDEVTVSLEHDDAVRIECSDKEVPCDETNTAFRAVKAFWKYTGLPPQGVTVRIQKRIPSQAGMAGGSTDAAAVLYALNDMTQARLDLSGLVNIAETIGADVPFCLYGGTMTAEGIGTILNPLPDMPEAFIVIVKPRGKVSTAEAYRLSDTVGYSRLKNADKIVNGICSGSLEDMAAGLYNKFEAVVSLTIAEPHIMSVGDSIKDIKRRLCEAGALNACMTGSGSAVYGLFDEEDTADAAARQLSQWYDQVFTARPIPHGVRFR